MRSKSAYTSKPNRYYILLLCVVGIVIIVSLFIPAYHYFIEPMIADRKTDEYKELYDAFTTSTPEPSITIGTSVENTYVPNATATPDTTDGHIMPAFEKMYEANNDIVGWLSIPNVGVNEPVFYTPGNQNYYLQRAPDGTYLKSGSLFMSEGSEINPQAQVLVIYGHNMKSGKMFGRLTEYKKYQTLIEHPLFTFNTLYSHGTWKIIAVLSTSIDLDANNFYYLKNVYANEDEFNDFVYNFRIRSRFIINDDLRYDDKLLILSTCNKEFSKNQRFVIIARKLRNGESTKINTSQYKKNPMPLMPVEYYATTHSQPPSTEVLSEHYYRYYGSK